jgi:hypothetical protein
MSSDSSGAPPHKVETLLIGLLNISASNQWFFNPASIRIQLATRHYTGDQISLPFWSHKHKPRTSDTGRLRHCYALRTVDILSNFRVRSLGSLLAQSMRVLRRGIKDGHYGSIDQ